MSKMNIIIPINKLAITNNFLEISNENVKEIFNNCNKEFAEILKLSEKHDIYLSMDECDFEIKEKLQIKIEKNIKTIESSTINYKEDENSISIIKKNVSESNEGPTLIYDKKTKKIYVYNINSEDILLIYKNDDFKGINFNYNEELFSLYDQNNHFMKENIDVNYQDEKNLGIDSIYFSGNEISSIVLKDSYLQRINFSKNKIDYITYSNDFIKFIKENLPEEEIDNNTKNIEKIREKTIEILETINILSDTNKNFNQHITIDQILSRTQEIIKTSKKPNNKVLNEHFKKIFDCFSMENIKENIINSNLDFILCENNTVNIFDILNLEISKEIEEALEPYDIKKINKEENKKEKKPR